MAFSKDSSQSLAQWLAYIEAIHPQEIEFGLTRVATVFQRLFPDGLPYAVITVAGTNGKGSCCAYLEAIFVAQAKMVGKYTSPHLQQFNERIMLDAQMADDAAIVAAFSLIESTRADIKLTYFEFSTLAALLVFAAATVDVAVLEVGLGGRLDAVNILEPTVSVVTSIGIDHVEWLGDDRNQIALEKAAIARPNSLCVVGELDFPPSAMTFLTELGAKVCRIGYELQVSLPVKEQQTWGVQMQVDGLQALELTGLQALNNPVVHQYRNAACAIVAADYFCRLTEQKNSTLVNLNKALVSAKPLGRCQVLSQQPLTILDVAHNEDSVAALREFLSSFKVRGRIYAVFSMLRDKDIAASLLGMMAIVDEWHIAELAVPRAASMHYLSEQLQLASSSGNPAVAKQLELQEHMSIEAAYASVKSVVNSADCIIVFGSFHVVGDILSAADSITEKSD